MFRTLSTRVALAAVVTFASSGAMAMALDVASPSNGLTGIYSSSVFGAPPACTGASPSYCAFFGALPTSLAGIVITSNPSGLVNAVPGGIGPTGVPVAPIPASGSYLGLTSNGVTSTLAGGSVTFAPAKIQIPAAATTANVVNAGMVFDSAPQTASVNGLGQSEFLVTVSCVGGAGQTPTGGLCPAINGDVLFLDLVKYRLFVQWDPTFTYFNADLIGQTSNNSFVYATLNSIPVPGAVWLMGSALGLLGLARRKVAA
jgi:hypothetical protein